MARRKRRYFAMHLRVAALVACVFLGILVLAALRDRYSETIRHEKDNLLSLSSLFNDITVKTKVCRSQLLSLTGFSQEADDRFSVEAY